MPLYEYLCQDCEQPAELLIRSGQQPTCPKCGGERMTKLLSVVAAPGRDAAGGRGGEPPTGPCGSHCGCFPGN
jgi:putative FmdB family regulatory protein